MGMKSVFAPLTIDESEILRDHLWSGRRKQAHVHGYVEGGMARETSEIVEDLVEARRLRWNAEHPEHTY
jgi:hypothetical protein